MLSLTLSMTPLSFFSAEHRFTSYGPFVMSTQGEILPAMSDYRAGKMGHVS